MKIREKCLYGFQRKSGTIVFILLVLTWLVSPLLPVCSQSFENKKSFVRNKGSSFLFQYNRNYRILYKDYKCNHSALDRMNLLIRRHRQDICSGASHLFITAYIRPKDLHNPKILDHTIVQANVVRAYIKVRHHIAHDYCTFSFDTTLHSNSLVRVRYIPYHYPIPQTIYSDSIQSANILEVITPVRSEECKKDTVLVKQMFLPTACVGETAKQSDPECESFRISSFFGIKTNLFYWTGITPELKRRDFIPNAELEWCFGRHWSLNADGAYVYLHNHNADQEQWGVSSIAIEPRFWLNRNNCFTGVYIGGYGLIGQFDVKLNTISEYGHTGDFHEGGISMGYYLPLSSRWGIEVGGRFGYRAVSGDIYRYVYPRHFYYDSSYTQNGFKLTGIRLLLTYRLRRSSDTMNR